MTVLLLAFAAFTPPDGWVTASPRDELRPAFSYDPAGGRDGKGAFVLTSDGREGLHGWFEKAFPVAGGKHYRFHAARHTTGVAVPRRSGVVRIAWQDDKGRKVAADEPPGPKQTHGYLPLAEAEHPSDGPAQPGGWVTVSAVYRAPAKATRAVVELQLNDAPGGKVVYGEVSFAEAPAPKPRPVRLATVHYTPKGGKSPMDNCRQYAPLIADAARQKADLVVLGETVTYVGTAKKPHEVAEPVPGPSTEYFGGLAKEHGLYVVVGLYERAGHLLYNVAVLIGPDGKVAGKYRKVCLPRDEIVWGVTAGRDYPVFETRFGKVGMMVCYDGFFPEVARELTARGAEVIAWPVWGCDPLLSSARACENHTYVVSSTYTDAASDWTLSAVYGHDGKPLARGQKWGTVVVAEVDLSRRHYWRNNLGDRRSEV
ncbi:MAG: carbon-nitrogen hydrolase family protein, partial [Gemmataceae bacterium]